MNEQAMSDVNKRGSQSHEQISSDSLAIPQPRPQKEELSRTGAEDDSKFEEEEYNAEEGKERVDPQKNENFEETDDDLYGWRIERHITEHESQGREDIASNSPSQSLTIVDIFCDKFLSAFNFSFSPNVDTNDNNDDDQSRTLEDRLLDYLTSPAFNEVNGLSLRFKHLLTLSRSTQVGWLRQ